MHHHEQAARPPVSLIILAVLMLIGLGWLGRVAAPPLQASLNDNEETVEARIIEVLEEGTLDQGGLQQPYQKLRLEILSGRLAGRAVTVDS